MPVICKVSRGKRSQTIKTETCRFAGCTLGDTRSMTDRDLGMKRRIMRRDFVSSVAVAISGSAAWRWSEATTPAASSQHGQVLDSSDEDRMDQLRGHSITYRIAVGLPNKAVKSSPYKRCLTNAMPMIPQLSATSLDSPCTPVWRPKSISVANWSGCAATSPDPPSLKSVCL